MGFGVLIEQGVRVVLAERGALDAKVGKDRADGAVAALENLPALLRGLTALAWRDSALPRDRAMLTVVMSYGFRDDDLVPAKGENLLFGLLDDAYLAYFAAANVRQGVPGVSAKSVADGRAALAAALPSDAVAALEKMVTTALEEIEAFGARAG